MAEKPYWLDRLFDKGRKQKIEQILGGKIGRMYACGAYGCVFRFQSPWVVKITTDIDEGPIWSYLHDFQEAHPNTFTGFTRIKRLIALETDYTSADRPLYIIVREEVAMYHKTGKTDAWDFTPYTKKMLKDPRWNNGNASKNSKELLGALNDLGEHRWTASQYHKLLDLDIDDPEREKALNQLRYWQAKLEDSWATRAFAQSFWKLVESEVVIRDIHDYNVGWRMHETLDGQQLEPGLIAFDPGATETTLEAERAESYAVNPFDGILIT